MLKLQFDWYINTVYVDVSLSFHLRLKLNLWIVHVPYFNSTTQHVFVVYKRSSSQRRKVILNTIKAYLLERAIPGIFKYA